MKINIAGSSVASKASEGPDGMVELGHDMRVWRTPSSTRQGIMHFTVLDTTTGAYPQCSCEGYTYRGTCLHSNYIHKVHMKELETELVKDDESDPFEGLQ